MNFKQFVQKYFGVQLPDAPQLSSPPKAIAPSCGVPILGGPCHCAMCRVSMLTVISQLAFRDVAKRRLMRQFAILPPPPGALVAARIKSGIEAEVNNYASN